MPVIRWRPAPRDHQHASMQQSTGWRDITALVPNRTGGRLYLRREGNIVWLNFDELACTDQTAPGSPTQAWQAWAALLPAGFRPPQAMATANGWTYAAIAPRSTEHAAGPMRARYTGDVLVYNATPTNRMLGLVSWTTPDAWPSTLPGAAV